MDMTCWLQVPLGMILKNESVTRAEMIEIMQSIQDNYIPILTKAM